MAIAIRDVREHELDSVLALNNAAGPTILALDSTRIRWFFDNADYFRIADVDGHVAGFLIAMRETSDHESPNFRWFRERFAAFVYIDRIVIAKPYRGLGLGRVFYADATSYAEVRVPVLSCEVFLEPRDDVSVLFHGTYGFQEVGQQIMPGLGKRVSLLAKNLPSFDFVRTTYLEGTTGQLPNQPWLAERRRAAQNSPLRAAGGI
ncbi:MAG TPA: GNAT family N-acetyltransferase [Tahibacter sp.]|uniref:GNAT family N-acetyltransferase n=1 Tax=Tahibacter sp. TaxID=2056211 RepID=UPI002CA18459|nr:GNAT family N-acetyltransferase [Tahibacter sp.]HSX59179.1 GNAT family N-acetyltransferase [Tahibacter sp.]